MAVATVGTLRSALFLRTARRSVWTPSRRTLTYDLKSLMQGKRAKTRRRSSTTNVLRALELPSSWRTENGKLKWRIECCSLNVGEIPVTYSVRVLCESLPGVPLCLDGPVKVIVKDVATMIVKKIAGGLEPQAQVRP